MPALAEPAARIVDLSHPIRAGLVTYPGLPAPEITPFLTREDSRGKYAPGTEFAMDVITMIGNTGTYFDSPFHRYGDGVDLAGLDLATLVDLPTEVFHLDALISPERRAITTDLVSGHDVRGAAVLLHTDGTGCSARRSTATARRSSPERPRRRSSTGAPCSSASTRSASTTPSRAANDRRTARCSVPAFTSSNTSLGSGTCPNAARASPRPLPPSRGSAPSPFGHSRG